MEKYLTIEREILKKYGFKCGMVYQWLKDHDGYWEGTITSLTEYLYPINRLVLRTSIISLDARKIIAATFKHKTYVAMEIRDFVKDDTDKAEKPDILSVSAGILKEKSKKPLFGR